MIDIRLCQSADWPAVWNLLKPVFRAGETYAFAPDISAAEAHHVWVETPTATFVATDGNGVLLGTYYLKPNQPGPGAHVCDCGYIVSASARGKGIATQLCEHSQREAIARGFRAMQFNLVVSTNEGAIRLWQKLGFAIVGTLPAAFKTLSRVMSMPSSCTGNSEQQNNGFHTNKQAPSCHTATLNSSAIISRISFYSTIRRVSTTSSGAISTSSATTARSTIG